MGNLVVSSVKQNYCVISSSTPGYVPNDNNARLYGNLDMSVCGGVTHNNQRVGTIQLPIGMGGCTHCGVHVQWDVSCKRAEVLVHTSTWTNLENIVQSERSQAPKVT